MVADVLNWAIWLAFVFEAVVMLRVVPDKKVWLRKHPLEVAIVLVTPPFLPASLEAARIFPCCACWSWSGRCSSPDGCSRWRACATPR